MRLIDADALWKDITTRIEEYCDIADLIDIIERQPAIDPEPQWIPVTEWLPEEDYCTGRGVQHSADVLVTIVNHADDDDAFVNMAFTVDGKWQLTNPIDYDGDTDVPEWCEIIAFMPLPEPWKGEQ